MDSKGDYRSAAARHILDGGHADAAVHFPLPPAQNVMIGSEMLGLRQALQGLHPADRHGLDAAFQEADEECQKPAPDKARMAAAICRLIKQVVASEDFREHAGKVLPRIAAIASWLGVNGAPLLKEAGISA